MPLARKIGPILASLAIAVVLWLIVRNLDRTPARFTVPVRYEFPESRLVLADRMPEVEVFVRATKAKLRTLQAGELAVRVRNTDGRPGREVVVLSASDVEAPFGVEVERVSPAQFAVRYERRETRKAPVRPEVFGKPAQGFGILADGISSQPAEVTVAGPAGKFPDPLVVRTERLDVSGRSEDLRQRSVALQPPGPEFSIDGPSTAEVVVQIRPTIVRRSFDDVPVEVQAGDRLVSAPNPKRLRVTVEGPQLQVERLEAGSVRATVDASSLEPRGQDYQVEPSITLGDGACPDCKVVGRSQTRVDLVVRGIRGRLRR